MVLATMGVLFCRAAMDYLVIWPRGLRPWYVMMLQTPSALPCSSRGNAPVAEAEQFLQGFADWYR
jgi:hypothetical protein